MVIIYRVYDTFVAWKFIGFVEAQSEDQAIQQAKDKFDQPSPIVISNRDFNNG